MKKIIKQKDEMTTYYSDKIKDSTTVAVFTYSGLDAHDMTILRKEMIAYDAKVHVLKNNIMSRSLMKAGYEEFKSLTGANAIVIGNGDLIAPLRAIKALSDDNDFVTFLGSVVENKYIDETNTLALAKLPNREGMYQMVLSCLTSPIRGVLYALKAVGETKTN